MLDVALGQTVARDLEQSLGHLWLAAPMVGPGEEHERGPEAMRREHLPCPRSEGVREHRGVVGLERQHEAGTDVLDLHEIAGGDLPTTLERLEIDTRLRGIAEDRGELNVVECREQREQRR